MKASRIQSVAVVSMVVLCAIGPTVFLVAAAVFNPAKMPLRDLPGPLVGAIIIAVIVLAVLFGNSPPRAPAEEDPRRRLTRRAAEVNTAITEAVRVMGELAADLDGLQRSRAALEAEAARQQEYLELDRDEAAKVMALVHGNEAGKEKAQRRREIVIAVAGCVAGAAFAVAWDLMKTAWL
ncbi:hypothetical protein AB0I28_15330 [Phytomonospora sp. NPDC050363]|uniref:hypothetical protein n=1 Tax=Phytomonospora sp. NPDC050363 TaxID=3155642 RepID=UPI0033CBD646